MLSVLARVTWAGSLVSYASKPRSCIYNLQQHSPWSLQHQSSAALLWCNRCASVMDLDNRTANGSLDIMEVDVGPICLQQMEEQQLSQPQHLNTVTGTANGTTPGLATPGNHESNNRNSDQVQMQDIKPTAPSSARGTGAAAPELAEAATAAAAETAAAEAAAPQLPEAASAARGSKRCKRPPAERPPPPPRPTHFLAIQTPGPQTRTALIRSRPPSAPPPPIWRAAAWKLPGHT